MEKTLWAILAAMIVVAIHAQAQATETGTMMCKGGIVSIGATAGEVTYKCGQPASATQREEKRVEGNARDHHDRVISAVSVDDWIYNFGPNQFQYRVLFENGRVGRIESLDYGY